MKLKVDFVTNSSSTAYIIYNKSNNDKDLVDFVKENPQLVEEYVEMYSPPVIITQERLIQSAINNNFTFKPGKNYKIFGDEDGTLIGRLFDYILRPGGESENFTWEFEQYLR